MARFWQPLMTPLSMRSKPAILIADLTIKPVPFQFLAICGPIDTFSNAVVVIAHLVEWGESARPNEELELLKL